MTESPPRRVADPARLAALRRSGALDLVGDSRLARVSRLATALLGTPVSLVSLVEADRQVFAAQVGLGEPWASRGQTPLSHSFCQHVVGDGSALVVTDAREDERLRDNRAIEDLGVVAYCGVPIRTPEGRVLGSFCVIDHDPREWTPEEVALVEDLGAIAQTELQARGPDRDRALLHDVRSALHGVLAGARTLAEAERVDEEVRAQLGEVVERQSSHLEVLLTRMLEGEVVDRGGAVGVDVHELVADVVEDYDLGTPADVVHRRNGDVRALVEPTALRRCLTNLIDNAVKHGGGVVEVGTTTVHDRAVITVTDQGPGIPDAEHESIFEAGRQGATTSAPGEGLGLATVRALTRAMGGDVSVSSAAHGGTTFSLEFPVATATAATEGVPAS